jgi:hypothetical protein
MTKNERNKVRKSKFQPLKWNSWERNNDVLKELILDNICKRKSMCIQHVGRFQKCRLPWVLRNCKLHRLRSRRRRLKKLLYDSDENELTCGIIPWKLYDSRILTFLSDDLTGRNRQVWDQAIAEATNPARFVLAIDLRINPHSRNWQIIREAEEGGIIVLRF